MIPIIFVNAKEYLPVSEERGAPAERMNMRSLHIHIEHLLLSKWYPLSKIYAVAAESRPRAPPLQLNDTFIFL